MSRIRANSPGVNLRLRALYECQRRGALPGPERECAETVLGQRLGIAALYAGRGDRDQAEAAALLACAGVPDTAEHRRQVLDAIAEIRRLIRRAAMGHGGMH